MENAGIHFRLDLVLQLVDTTTGRAVTEQNVQYLADDETLKPIPRGNGTFVFINTGRRDRILTLKVAGYEPCQVEICYDMLDEAVPLKQVFLIPSENPPKGEALCSLTGQLSGLEELEAVSLSQSFFTISEFDERKRLMKLFVSQGRLIMENVHYGLLSQDRRRYEHFEVEEELPPNTVRIKKALEEPFSVNASISRVVFGTVSPDGSYLLRVRDSAKLLIWLVRYRVNGEYRFQTVDFHNCAENELK